MATTHYLWDPDTDSVLEEYDETGATIATYDVEPVPSGRVISQHRDGETRWHQHDGSGNTVALSDETGAVTDTYAYDAWGNEIASTGSTPNPYRFGGEKGYCTDAETGSISVRRRTYSPTIARWTSADPLAIFFRDTTRLSAPAAYLLYVFVRNSPVDRIDPSGLQDAPAQDPCLPTPTARMFASPAFGTAKFHLCIEADIWKVCKCNENTNLPTLMDKTTYQMELLAFSGKSPTGKELAPVKNRVGSGPSGVGLRLIDNDKDDVFVGLGIKEAWGILLVPGGSCRGDIVGSVRVLNDTKDSTIEFGGQLKQCKLAECLVNAAREVAKAATGKVKYELLTMNSNSFIGTVYRRCNAVVDDKFKERVDDFKKTPAWGGNFVPQ